MIAAMEVGSRHARTDIVAFTDDDAVPRTDWLRYLLAPYGDRCRWEPWEAATWCITRAALPGEPCTE